MPTYSSKKRKNENCVQQGKKTKIRQRIEPWAQKKSILAFADSQCHQTCKNMSKEKNK